MEEVLPLLHPSSVSPPPAPLLSRKGTSGQSATFLMLLRDTTANQTSPSQQSQAIIAQVVALQVRAMRLTVLSLYPIIFRSHQPPSCTDYHTKQPQAQQQGAPRPPCLARCTTARALLCWCRISYSLVWQSWREGMGS